METPIQEESEEAGENEIKPEDYIPVKKAASVLGLASSNLNMNLMEVRSVKLLDHLIRTHVMLAMFASKGSSRHVQGCLMAWGFLNRIWQVGHRFHCFFPSLYWLYYHFLYRFILVYFPSAY